MFAELKTQRVKIRKDVYEMLNCKRPSKVLEDKYPVVLVHRCIMEQTLHRTRVSLKESTSRVQFHKQTAIWIQGAFSSMTGKQRENYFYYGNWSLETNVPD